MIENYTLFYKYIVNRRNFSNNIMMIAMDK